MNATTLQLMHDQVRAIYRALTGQDLPEPTEREETGAALSAEAVARGFAELDALARRIPTVAERVPPFSFAPPLDALDTERELVIELGVPSVEKKDVQVELEGETVTISGFRSGGHAVNGHTYFHAELPRGPFRRVIRLPYPVMGEPRLELDQGLIRVRFSKVPRPAPAQA